MSLSVAYSFKATITEVLPGNTDPFASEAKRTVTLDAYDESGTLTGATTPPVTTQASFLLTLTAGAATIDLRALTGTNGASIDGNGLKVQLVRIKNLGANTMTFKSGATNGHSGIFTATDGTVVQPGGRVMVSSNDNGDDISATDKTWDVTGTGAQTAEVTIIMG